jgi:FkbM family methyltransferase
MRIVGQFNVGRQGRLVASSMEEDKLNKRSTGQSLAAKASAPISAIRAHLSAVKMQMIFDVGANIGQSTKLFQAHFPEASIHAFEPVVSTFKILERTVSNLGSVTTHNVALGRVGCKVYLTNKPGSVVNRIVSEPKPGGSFDEVPMLRGDDFCASHGIIAIDYLKIDTEGYDLDVLMGFVEMLRAQRISLVEAEVGMNPLNRRHVPFERVKVFLEAFGYFLFQIYDMTLDLHSTGRAHLRRANAVFISEETICGNIAPSASRAQSGS